MIIKMFIQKSSKKQEAKETGPQVARANLFITIKTFRMIQTEFREGKEITRKTNKLKN